jgi:hypothetical protein
LGQLQQDLNKLNLTQQPTTVEQQQQPQQQQQQQQEYKSVSLLDLPFTSITRCIPFTYQQGQQQQQQPQPYERFNVTESETKTVQVTTCPVCGVTAERDLTEFQLHVEGHFTD